MHISDTKKSAGGNFQSRCIVGSLPKLRKLIHSKPIRFQVRNARIPQFRQSASFSEVPLSGNLFFLTSLTFL